MEVADAFGDDGVFDVGWGEVGFFEEDCGVEEHD